MKRDVGLKPRTTGDLPPEKLEQILGKIYPEETVAELMEKLCDSDGERRTDNGIQESKLPGADFVRPRSRCEEAVGLDYRKG